MPLTVVPEPPADDSPMPASASLIDQIGNGYHASREILTAAGAVEVKAPRVNDKRIDEESGEHRRFSSAILPAWAGKTPQITAVLPLLYVHRLSSGDFVPALGQFLGSTTGLSAAVITRLTEQWKGEQRAFAARDLSGVDYVHLWVDGIHVNIRLEEHKLCLLAQVKAQRCWFHQIANVLGTLPMSAHAAAKKHLAEIWNAENREHAQAAVNDFQAAYAFKLIEVRPGPMACRECPSPGRPRPCGRLLRTRCSAGTSRGERRRMTSSDRYDYCGLYLRGASQEAAIELTARAIGAIRDGRLLRVGTIEIEIRRNDNCTHDGADFPTWPIKMEIERGNAPSHQVIETVSKILTHAWQAGHDAVAACDYEDELPDHGGYPRYRD